MRNQSHIGEPERFGFLREGVEFEFDGGRLSLLSGYENIFAPFEREVNWDDTFYYPPIIPDTERVARLFQLPASHALHLAAHESRAVRRSGSAAFIMHLLGYLYGAWLQFEGLWFDSRVPGRSTHNVAVAPKVASNFVSRCYDRWRMLPDDAQRRQAINILFMHCRAPTYRWYWERFAIQYMVLDACYALATQQRQIHGGVSHERRPAAMCEAFSLRGQGDIFRVFAKLRNDLFHQALWAGRSVTGDAYHVFDWIGEMPTGPFGDPLQADRFLRRLNQRLIAGVLGYGGPHTLLDWREMGTSGFRRPEDQGRAG